MPSILARLPGVLAQHVLGEEGESPVDKAASRCVNSTPPFCLLHLLVNRPCKLPQPSVLSILKCHAWLQGTILGFMVPSMASWYHLCSIDGGVQSFISVPDGSKIFVTTPDAVDIYSPDCEKVRTEA